MNLQAVAIVLVILVAFLIWKYGGSLHSLFTARPEDKDKDKDKEPGSGTGPRSKDGYYDEIDDLITSIYSAQLRLQ